ncbi:hypothetical protein MUK42_04142 [Musa troglodytarum]|uniref:DUF3741 domain-containing protein n=1 Tax=Musa troglodytarum TaxID=320322 RepID=A0A9E7GEG3_9LILI|nr:hypothetical protein MUK42_04142 [Musa troglodytarum]
MPLLHVFFVVDIRQHADRPAFDCAHCHEKEERKELRALPTTQILGQKHRPVPDPSLWPSRRRPTAIAPPTALHVAVKRQTKSSSASDGPHPKKDPCGPHGATLFPTTHGLSSQRPSTVRSNPKPAPAVRPASLSIQIPSLTSFPDLRDDKILERTLARALLALSLMKTPRRPPLDFNSDAAGCLSGVIRRLLCASLRHNVHSQGVAMQKKKPPASPCVVARLMGLDSMPVFPYTPPDSVKRSRSAESWPGVSCSEGSRGMQIKTSVSFRGAPTYLRQENEEFLVLSFAPERKAETTMAKGRKDKASTGDSKEREANRAERRVAEKKTRNQQKNSHKHQQNLPERKHKNGRGSVVPSPKEKLRRDSRTITKLGGSNGKAAEQKKMQKLAAAQGKNEAGCSSQDSSPVSVLDYGFVDGEYSISVSPPTSDDERRQQSPRRRLSSKFENLSSTSPCSHTETISGIMKSSRAEQVVRRDWSHTWEKICTLTEEDLKSTTWPSVDVWRSEEVGGIAAAVALEMLDAVVVETASELSSYATRSRP